MDVWIDNRLGPRNLTPAEVDSLAGQTDIVVFPSHGSQRDVDSLAGKVTIEAAGFWNEHRIDLIITPEVEREPGEIERVLADGSDRPLISIGYTVEEPGVRVKVHEIVRAIPEPAVPAP